MAQISEQESLASDWSSFCNSLQLWINLGKVNLFRLHVLSLLPPLKETHSDSWYLLLSFVSLKHTYNISGCSEFEIIYSAFFFKWGIWLLFPVLELYFGFFKISMVIQNNGMWELRGQYQFCHCCLCFYILDYLKRFLQSKLSYTDSVPFKHSVWHTWHSMMPIICISANGIILCWEASKCGKISRILSSWWRQILPSKMLLVPTGEGHLRSMHRYWVLSLLSYRNSK